jgi:hypothetical protein
MSKLIIIAQRSVREQRKFGLTFDQRQRLAILVTIAGAILVSGLFGTAP